MTTGGDEGDGSPSRDTQDYTTLSPLTPYGNPPKRVESQPSLFGEDIVNSSRPSLEDDDRTTPPSTYGSQQATSPPVFAADGSVRSRQSSKPFGRPPLAPQGSNSQLPGTFTIGQQHRKSQSAGDYSFMSALTDPSSSENGDFPAMRRGRGDSGPVSFDIFDNVSPGEATPTSILQPILTDDITPPEKSQMPASTGFVKSKLPSVASKEQIAFEAKLNIEEKSALESEAESAILAAIEEQQRVQSKPTGAHILSQVPEDAVHNFDLTKSTTRPVQTDQESEQHAAKKSASNVSSISSESVRRSNLSTKESSKLSQTKKFDAKSPKTTLLGKDSGGRLEQTLFGLSKMMEIMHETKNSVIGGQPKEEAMPSKDSGLDGNPVRHRRVKSDFGPADPLAAADLCHDQDALARNANLLLRNQFSRQRPVKHLSVRTSNVDYVAGQEFKTESGDIQDIETGIGANGNDTEKKPSQKGGIYGRGTRIVAGTSKYVHDLADETWDEFVFFSTFLKPRRRDIWLYSKGVLLYLIIPSLITASVLFYAVGNPSMGIGGETAIKNSYTVGKQVNATLVEEEKTVVKPHTSISWFILFLGVRHIIVFSMALFWQMIVIDFLALKTRVLIRLLGPICTLIIVQSKGWPFLLSTWAFIALCLLSGVNKFAEHWLFWQDKIGLFNEENPSGKILSTDWNYLVLFSAFFVGLVVSLKRFIVGLYLGKRTYINYGANLARVIHRMIVISQVAKLGRELESHKSYRRAKKRGRDAEMVERWSWRGFSGKDLEEDDEEEEGVDLTDDMAAKYSRVSLARGINRTEQDEFLAQAGNEPVISKSRDTLTESLRESQKARIADLLDRWEEPEIVAAAPDRVSINAIIEFRKALAFMDPIYPFTTAFGLADSREHCVEASQEVYRRLLLEDPESGILDFSTLVSLCKTDEDGEIDPSRVKDLIRIFRPNREGKLTMVEFTRSVDDVYKSLKMLRAAIVNASQIDNAFESIINVGFYFLVGCIVLSIFQIDPFALFVSVSGIIISFSFLVGAASSKYFEGILFIFARRPYDIGDRVSISDPMEDTSGSGSLTWFVERVDLFTTTLRFAMTNEVCTVSNGSLASTRIVNAARSPQAVLYLKLKFSVAVPYSKVKVFRKTVEGFVKARPREWLAFSGFRADRVEADLGYIQYVIAVQHRESWQEIGRLLDSRATLYSFCLEVQKKLGMNYKAPSLPVDLQLNRDFGASGRTIQLAPSTEYSDETGRQLPKPRAVVGDGRQSSDPSQFGVSVQDIAALFGTDTKSGG